MRRFSVLVAALVVCALVNTPTISRAANYYHSWDQRFGDSLSQEGRCITTDAFGNVVLTGFVTGTVNFGGGDLLNIPGSSEGLAIASFNAAGVHRWSHVFIDTDWVECLSVATDMAGDVYVTGYFGGTINLGGSNLLATNTDIFVAKYDGHTGAHIWSQRFGGANDQKGTAVTADYSGNIYVAGYFAGTVDFGGGVLTSAGSTDVFLAKLTSAGAHVWSKRFGDASAQLATSVVVDYYDNVVLVGHFYGTVNFGGTTKISAGNDDIFVAKLNPLGTHQWSQAFGDAASQGAAWVATDHDRSVIVAGQFQGSVNFGGGSFTTWGGEDIYLVKFNYNGYHQWSRHFGSIADDTLGDLDSSVGGDIVMTGHFTSPINLGGGSLVSAGYNDVFVNVTTSAGAYAWGMRYGSADFDWGYGVDIDVDNNVLLTGAFTDVTDFGGGPVMPNGVDIFVLKLNLSEPLITSIADIGNDQGRKVRIRFNRSGADDGSSPNPVIRYDAFRRDDPTPAATKDANAALRMNNWTYAGSTPAYGDDTYGIDVPTVGDSTPSLGTYYSVFVIRAATDTPTIFYDSPPDSGCSVDNLAPGVPGSLVYHAGALSWNESTAEDFDYFSVYGSSTSSFASATLVDYCVAPSMSVSSSPYTFYFVTATDFSGNEGKPAVVNTLSGVGETPASHVLSISAYPNPFNPATTVRYTVPSAGRVSVTIHDARGARVAVLFDGACQAGAYTKAWNGRDMAGRTMSSGVYFARVTHASGTKTYKMILLK